MSSTLIHIFGLLCLRDGSSCLKIFCLVFNSQTIQFIELIDACNADKAKDIVSAGVCILLQRIKVLGEALRSGKVDVKVNSCPSQQ